MKLLKTKTLQPRLKALLSKAWENVLKALHTFVFLAILKISMVYFSCMYLSKEWERYFQIQYIDIDIHGQDRHTFLVCFQRSRVTWETGKTW